MKQIILNEDQIKELDNYLAELPFKFANPILQFLSKNLKDVEEKEKDAI
jgi:hypothetical protein